MGTPSLVFSGTLNPNCQQFAIYHGKYEVLYRNASHLAFPHSGRSLNLRARSSLSTRIGPLLKTRVFPKLLLVDSRDSGFLLRRRRDLRCRAEAGQGFQPALKLAKTIQTDSLPTSVRDSTMRAIDELGRRVTNGDVASRTGLKVTQAESALQALAADSGGFLEVSDEGDVLYVFPKDYRANLVTKSFRMRIEPALNKIQSAAAYLIRISFGTALVASIVIVYSAILVLLSSGRGDEDNRGNRGGYGNQRYNNSGMNFYISPMDLFWYVHLVPASLGFVNGNAGRSLHHFCRCFLSLLGSRFLLYECVSEEHSGGFLLTGKDGKTVKSTTFSDHMVPCAER